MHNLVALRRVLPMNEVQEQLDIHLGLKVDPDTQFQQSSSAVVTETSYSQDESASEVLTDSDFMADLKRQVLSN